MKKRVCLPFEDQPYTLMYHNVAFPTGIIQGNTTGDILPWLCGKYINCLLHKNSMAMNRFNICVSDNWAVHDGILFRQRLDVFPEMFNLICGDYVSFFRKMIAMGNYVNGTYNEEFIPGKSNYNKKYFSHDFLLIGYDDVTGNFISVGYLKDQKFQRFLIPYDNMRNAIVSMKQSKLCFDFLEYNSFAQYTLGMNRIISELNDYIFSTTSMKISLAGKYWGLDAIQHLGCVFEDNAQKGELIDVRYTRGLMEHKFFMQMRINYLHAHGYIDVAHARDLSEQIYKMSTQVYLLAIKYNISSNKTIGVNIKERINEIVQIEREYLPIVLEKLQKRAAEV